jgi:hypothetical protein
MSSDRLKFLRANASFLFRSRQELVMLILWMIIIIFIDLNPFEKQFSYIDPRKTYFISEPSQGR